jgi:hypothetical protein
MIIRYSNGKTLEGVTLSLTDNMMRVALSGHDDVMELYQVNGMWISEDCEAVQIERPGAGQALPASESDCVCPADLADRLIQLLLSGAGDERRNPGLLAEGRYPASVFGPA